MAYEDNSLDRLTAEIKAARDILALQMAGDRRPSKAAAVGAIQPPFGGWPSSTVTAAGASHPWLKASLPDGYRPGDFLTAVMNARSRDADEQRTGKAMLGELGLRWQDIPDGSQSKAVLGLTGPTGGYVLPNAYVDPVIKPAVGEALFTNGPDPLLTVRTNVMVRGVDQPYRTGAPTRMTFQTWGQTKENVDEAYGTYSALMGTMARIIDIGKSYARMSAGAAEQDVMDELTKARDLGEVYYVLAGAGTGTLGSGDPTTGVVTALLSGSATYRTAFSGASRLDDRRLGREGHHHRPLGARVTRPPGNRRRHRQHDVLGNSRPGLRHRGLLARPEDLRRLHDQRPGRARPMGRAPAASPEFRQLHRNDESRHRC